MWTLDKAVALCKQIEEVCPRAGCHVALTGGVLYKAGPRKDLDLLFYRIRQSKQIDVELLFELLGPLGIVVENGNGWVYKGIYRLNAPVPDENVDLFFPEQQPRVKSVKGFSEERY